MKPIRASLTLRLACAVPLLLALPLARAAEGKIQLRMADSLPVGHIISEHATKPWMELVSQLSRGRIEVKYFPAEQMGKAKDMLMLTQSGVVDIGYVGPSYVSEKMPLSAVGELPGSFSSACEVTHAYWKLAREGGHIYTHEFKPNRIRPLFMAALPPYQMIIGNSRTVSSLRDTGGMKLRASGGAQNLTLAKMNVVPVRMAPPEIYESMSRGTIDGTLLSFVSVDSYKLQGLTRAATVGANFGTVIVTYSISEAKWARLPKDVQDVLREAGERITGQACAAFDRQEQAAAEKLKAAGVKLLALGESDRAAAHKAAEEVAAEWAADLDRRGKSGTATLKAFREALQQAR